MKKQAILLILQFLFIGKIAVAQKSNPIACEDCLIKCMCYEFYKNEIDTSLNNANTIINNWNDFFGEDLETIFPIRAGINVASLKFDGLGCIYPNSLTTQDYKNIKNNFLGKEKRFRNVAYKTFYTLYNNVYAKKGDTVEKAFVSSLAMKIDTSKLKKVNKTEYEYLSFRNQWNDTFLLEKIRELDTIIKTKKVTKIIFFIHGYNVPYSLAHKQGNVLIDSILNLDKTLKPADILFVRVFWPSGNFKKDNFIVGACDYDNYENLRTALQFTFISNRAYLAGITLRNILREIKTDLPLNIITHSHGSTVATTALINTVSKLQRSSVSYSINKTLHPNTEILLFPFEEVMTKEDFPNKTINVFLNAPSIPGEYTFKDIDTNNKRQNKYKFFVGYNEHDEVLQKKKFHLWKLYLKFIRVPKLLSATTLGCNYRNEVYNTQKIFNSNGLQDNFWSGVNSFQKQHDFFCYIKQLEFKRNLKLFIEDKLFIK